MRYPLATIDPRFGAVSRVVSQMIEARYRDLGHDDPVGSYCFAHLVILLDSEVIMP
jgi:hypothetical protein